LEKKTNIPRLFLIDGNSLLYRAFFALPETMKTSGGLQINAAYGFTGLLMKILLEEPDMIAVAFDRPAATFRHLQYDQYKANRQKAPEGLISQLPIVKEVLSSFSIPVFELDGYEADDIIATIAEKAKDAHVVIVTGDRDTFQIVSERVSVMATVKGVTETVLYDPGKVEESLGVPPERVVDYKALAGDASDNIPGVKGIGSKGAVSLIKEFGAVENILDNTDRLKGKLRDKMIEGKDSAVLSKKLATLDRNVPITVDIEKLKRTVTDWQKTGPVFEKYEFKTLLKKYGKAEAPEVISALSEEKAKKSALGHDYKIIDDESYFAVLIKNIEEKGRFAFDTETDSLDTLSANLEAVSVSFSGNTGYYLSAEFLSRKGVRQELKRIFEDANIKKAGHNVKFDIEVLDSALGIKVKGVDCDTMLAAYILDPTAGKYNLKYQGAKYFGRTMTTYEDLMDASKSADFKGVPEKEAADYACQDADVTWQLSRVLVKELKDKGLYEVFSKIEVPLIEVLVAIEQNGVYIDRDKLKDISVEIEGRLKRLQTEILVMAGEEFNINSPKQLAQILFGKLKLPVLRKTKTGPSTDAEVLEELASNFEIAQKLLEFRQLNKLKTTYVDVFPELINPSTNRIHASFNQIVTATGRLSSSDPNLQNIPVRSQTGRLMREVFTAQDKSSVILSADYSQIELRILAHLSRDPNLMEDFIKDRDVHSATAADIYDVKIEEVTKEMRSAAKTINFGIIYGMSAFGLSKALRIKKNEAQDFIDRYFYKYSGVKRYLDSTIEFAKKRGYVETLLGRRRYIPDINSLNQSIAQMAERTAINTPVQGSAADIIKAAMIKIHNKLKTQNSKSKMIMQIHDELVFECPQEEVKTLDRLVPDLMCRAVELAVPLKVDCGVGTSWGEAKL